MLPLFMWKMIVSKPPMHHIAIHLYALNPTNTYSAAERQFPSTSFGFYPKDLHMLLVLVSPEAVARLESSWIVNGGRRDTRDSSFWNLVLSSFAIPQE